MKTKLIYHFLGKTPLSWYSSNQYDLKKHPWTDAKLPFMVLLFTQLFIFCTANHNVNPIPTDTDPSLRCNIIIWIFLLDGMILLAIRLLFRYLWIANLVFSPLYKYLFIVLSNKWNFEFYCLLLSISPLGYLNIWFKINAKANVPLVI